MAIAVDMFFKTKVFLGIVIVGLSLPVIASADTSVTVANFEPDQSNMDMYLCWGMYFRSRNNSAAPETNFEQVAPFSGCNLISYGNRATEFVTYSRSEGSFGVSYSYYRGINVYSGQTYQNTIWVASSTISNFVQPFSATISDFETRVETIVFRPKNSPPPSPPVLKKPDPVTLEEMRKWTEVKVPEKPKKPAPCNFKDFVFRDDMVCEENATSANGKHTVDGYPFWYGDPNYNWRPGD